MSTATLLSMDQYLQTSYRPDREFIAGELRERNVGQWEHARVQFLLALWFGSHEQAWGTTGSTEQRTLVSPGKIRIPDVVVMRKGPQPPVLLSPPLLVVEILSPDDTYSDTQERAQDYLAMGVDMVWIIDPKSSTGKMISGDTWVGAETLSVPRTDITVHLPTLFEQV